MAVRPMYQAAGGNKLDSIVNAVQVTPSDVATADATLPIADGIYVGGAGDVAVVMAGGTGAVVVFKAPPVGTILPIRTVRVAATGTTATNLMFLYGAHP